MLNNTVTCFCLLHVFIQNCLYQSEESLLLGATILDKMLEHGSQDRATLPLPPCSVGLENPNEISCRLCLTTLQGEGSRKGWWCFNDFCQ